MAGFWHVIPFVRLLIPLAVGIGLNMFYNINALLLLVLLITSTSCIYLSSRFIKNYINYYTGIFITLTFLFTGIGLNKIQQQILNPNHFSKYPYAYLIIQINEQPIIKKSSIKAVAKVLAAVNGNNYQKQVAGNLLVYFSKDSAATMLNYGDLILIKANYQEVNPPQNPYEFNYKKYLGFNQIQHQQYLPKNSYVNLKLNTGWWHKTVAYNIQRYIKNVLNQFVQTKAEVGVAQALLYGFDDDIDPELIKAYGNTGTLHVLAVSGMHVGIIYWVLALMLAPLEKVKKLRNIKYPFLIFFIWSYSVLCGLSPSILRAAVMITFFIIGNIIKRKGNPYNTLAASAFLLIVINSNIIASVGFQLSYLAVLGIIGVHPLLYKKLIFKSWLGDNIWKIISVSVSAQFTTFPVGILYFHQFPVYFLLSNLLIIPITTAVIYAGIILIIVSKIYWPAIVFGVFVKWLIALTNYLVLFIEQLPFAYITGISITVFQTIVIYIICVAFFIYMLMPLRFILNVLLFAILVLVSINVYNNVEINKRKTLTFYHIKNTTALSFINGKQCLFAADADLLNNKDKFHFHIQQHLWYKKAVITDTVIFNNAINYIQTKDFTIWINKLPQQLTQNKSYVLFTGNKYFNISAPAIKPHAIIIANSMPLKKQYFLKNYALQNNIHCYMLANSGFAAFDFN